MHNRLHEARTALKTGDLATARDLLVREWQVTRSPTVAGLVDLLDPKVPDAVTTQLAQILTPRVATSLANMKKLAKLDDPRLASWTLAALANPPFCAPSAEDFLLYLATTMDRLVDPRLEAQLPTIRAVLSARVSRKPIYVKVLARLAATCAKRPGIGKRAGTTLELEEELVQLADPLRETGRTVESLLAEVYAHPDDDAPRMVLADALLERADPRGEFITLQLARGRTGEPSERELELLQRHGKMWLGNLAPVLSFGKSYSRTTFVRGFVAVADFIFKAEKKVKLVQHDPAWATIEKFEAAWESSLLEHAPLRALRSVTIDRAAADLLERRTEPFPAVTNVEIGRGAKIPRLRQLFPALTTLAIGDLPDPERLGELGVTELAIDLRCDADALEGLEQQHGVFVATLLRVAATIEHLSIRAPHASYPAPKPVRYVRGPTGRYVKT